MSVRRQSIPPAVPNATISSDKMKASGNKAKPASTVAVYRNGNQVGTATANNAGVWSYTFDTVLAAGDVITYDAVLPSLASTIAAIPVAGANVGLTMTQLVPNRVYQRSVKTGGLAGKGFGSIVVAIGLTAAASVIEYRLRDADATSTVIKDWASAGTNLTANTTNVTCTGVPANAKRYLLDLRANNDNSQIVLGTAPVMMGRLIAMAGQSLAVRLLGRIGGTTLMSDLGITPESFGWINAAYYDSPSIQANFGSWAKPEDGSVFNSAFIGDYLNRSVTASGVACGVVGSSVGGVNAAYFNPGGFGYDKFMQSLDVAGGAFEHFLWLQGHTDSQNGLTASDYSAQLDKVLVSLNSKTNIAFTKVICTVPNISSNQWGTPDQINAVRMGATAWCAANSATFIQPIDIELGDGVHQTQVGAQALSRHFFRATRTEFGLTNKPQPVIASASRADGSKSIVMPITLSAAATKLVSVGNPATRFNVFPKGTTSGALALDATTPIVVGTNTITLNLAADPGNGVGVDVYYGYPYDPANPGQTAGIYDDAVDGDGITLGRGLSVNLTAISTTGSTASTGTGTGAAGGTGTGATGGTGGTGGTSTPSGPVLTMSNNIAYAAAASGFGQARSVGSGATAANASPLTNLGNTYTLDFRVLLPARPNATIVLAGQNESLWVGTNGSGLLVTNVNGQYIGTSTPSADGNTPFIGDNVWHHVEVDVAANGVKVFLDGVLAASYTGTPSVLGAISASFGVGCLNATGNFTPGTGVLIDEVAVWNYTRHTAAFTLPTAPYTGTETGLKALWHLDGNGNSGI